MRTSRDITQEVSAASQLLVNRIPVASQQAWKVAMADQQNFGGMRGAFNVDLHDPVFEPSNDFHFEEDSHHMMPDAFSQPGDFAL